VAVQFFIRNLSWTTTARDVGEFYLASGIEVSVVLVYYDPEVGRPRGFALVETAREYDLDTLVTSSERAELAGRRLMPEIPTSDAFLRHANIPPIGRKWRDYWEADAMSGAGTAPNNTGQSLLRTTDETTRSYLLMYLRSIESDCRHVPWIAVVGSEAGRVETDTVFTDLEVSVARPSVNSAASTTPSLKRVQFYDFVAVDPGQLLLIHGPFGSGKTMLLKALTLSLLGADDRLSGRFPIWLPLARLRQHLENNTPADASALWNCIRYDIDQRFGRSLGEKVFNAVQTRGLAHSFFLLDGLDDLPSAELRRSFVGVASRFAHQLGDRATVVITGRPHVQDAYEQVSDCTVLSLPPLSPAQAMGVLASWMNALRPDSDSDPQHGARLAELTAAIVTQDDLRHLSQRPLYLAALATMDAVGWSPATSTVDLYEAIVGLYMSQWTAGVEGRERSADQARFTEAMTTHMLSIRQGLEKLAYHTIGDTARPGQNGGAVDGIIDPVLVYGVIASVLPEHAAPRSVTRFLDERLGIIANMSGGYTFPHKSVMEFLAAGHIAGTSNPLDLVEELLRKDAAGNREVVAFYFAKQLAKDRSAAIDCMNRLLSMREVPTEGVDSISADIAIGKSIRHLIRRSGEREGLRLEAYAKRIAEYLSSPVDVHDRVQIGDILATVGDGRPGAASTKADALWPAMDWIRIPAVTFLAGSKSSVQEWTNSVETGLGSPVQVTKDFLISRYPVTVGQFERFVEDGGYANPAYWDSAGTDWLEGRWKTAWGDRSNWLATHLATVNQQRVPLKWQQQLLYPNRPIVGVCWFEALAFARWMTSQYQAAGSVLADETAIVRLPFELEWEVAARGVDGRQWPWGSEWNSQLANTHECGIEHLCAVGLFPEADSPFGVSDMSGNCWDWTASSSSPYSEGCQPADPMAPDVGVSVRGGSWCHDRFSARGAFRDWNVPGDRSDTVGFRLVVASPAPHVQVGELHD
jgi:formylglycine-generating enzyme required for sulfatase activity